MILYLFLLIAVVGVVLLISLIGFSNTVSKEYPVKEEVEVNTHQTKHMEGAFESVEKTKDSRRREKILYLPVQRVEYTIPGLREGQVVHFIGNGTLYSVESSDDVSKIEIKPSNFQKVLEGELVLTPQFILVHRGDEVKKIALRMIEKYHFIGDYLVVKRKRVKTKKDIFQVNEHIDELKYIVQALV